MPLLSENSFKSDLVVLRAENSQDNGPFSLFEVLFF